MTAAKKKHAPKKPVLPPEVAARLTFAGRMRQWLLTGLLILAPSVITFWLLFRILNWFDGLIGRYIQFEALGGARIPGLGILATLLLLLIVGGIGSWIGGRWLVAMWDAFLSRIPGVGILYGSTKSLGEALLTRQRQAFRQVVLVQWPYKGVWRVGFVTGQADSVAAHLPEPVEVVFVPHTPNPASGFVHYVPKSELVYLDWAVEDGLKVVVSGGVIQPGEEAKPANGDAAAAK